VITPDTATAPGDTEPGGGWTKIIGRMAAALRFNASGQPRIGRGNLAALRRMNPEAHDIPAFWRLVADATEGDVPRDDDLTTRWALIAHGMALMAPDHDTRTEIGLALHQIGYLEWRLARLLNARGPQFRALVPRLCRHLAAKQQPIDWRTFARLILTESHLEPEAERIRRRIAQEYYRAAFKAEAIAAA
jgi:CRISPR type I-E-associated protein CasB/Cse2